MTDQAASDTKRAILFDLYGTLLRFGPHAFLRELQRTIGIAGTRERKVAMKDLLVRAYSDDEEMFAGWCRLVGAVAPDATQVASCKEVIERHVATIHTNSSTGRVSSRKCMRGQQRIDVCFLVSGVRQWSWPSVRGGPR